MLGIGSTKGSPIPDPQTGDYMRDNSGETVMSALNEQMCREIAQAGGGAYIHVENNSNAQRLLDEELDKLEKSETDSTIYSDFDEQFQAVGIIALLLLILEICILDRKSPLLNRVSLFNRNKNIKMSGQRFAFLLLFLSLTSFLLPLTASAQSDRRYIRDGNSLFASQKFQEAEVAYTKAVEQNGKNPQAHYNLGSALMMQQKDSAAVQEFLSAAKLETNTLRRSQAYHNIGVVHQRHRQFGEAIEAYKESLRLNPGDDETRYNLVLCQQQQKNQPQDQQKQDQQKQDQQKQDEQQKQDQQKQDEQKKQDQQKQQQQQPKMSKENAEQLLEAAMQRERQTQERMKEMQKQNQRQQNEKNW